MLIIRKEQMEVLETDVLRRFINDMVTNSYEFSPVACQIIGDSQVRSVVNNAIEKAELHGFTNRGSIQLYIEMTFLFGSGFDSDPQYPWEMEIYYNKKKSQEKRTEYLYQRVIDYNEKVSGRENVYTLKALHKLSIYANSLSEISADRLKHELLSEIENIFPQKFNYSGEDAFRELIIVGEKRAYEYKLQNPREITVITLLMYAFGHKCLDDPLYPWIKQTLNDPSTYGSSARTNSLVEKAVLWIDQFLINSH